MTRMIVSFAFVAGLAFTSLSCVKRSADSTDESEVMVGYGDFKGKRLSEVDLIGRLRGRISEADIGKAVCTAYFESDLYVEAQHDNRFDRQPDPTGPVSASVMGADGKGLPLRYTFKVKPACVRDTKNLDALNRVCLGSKNDNLKGYKTTGEGASFGACIKEQQAQMFSAAELVALAKDPKASPEARAAFKKRAQACSYDRGLYEINDYWGTLSFNIEKNANGSEAISIAAECADMQGDLGFDADRSIACAVKMAGCNKNKPGSCNFTPWHGYTANKAKCDAYVPCSGTISGTKCAL